MFRRCLPQLTTNLTNSLKSFVPRDALSEDSAFYAKTKFLAQNIDNTTNDGSGRARTRIDTTVYAPA